MTATAIESGSTSSSSIQLPVKSATTSASFKSSAPTTPPTSIIRVPTDSKVVCPTTIVIPDAPADGHKRASWQHTSKAVLISLIVAQVALYLLLQDKTLYYTTAAFLRLVLGDHKGFLSLSDLGFFAVVTIARLTICRLLQVTPTIYAACIILYLIFDGCDDILDISCSQHLPLFEQSNLSCRSHYVVQDTQEATEAQELQLLLSPDQQQDGDAKSLADLYESSEIALSTTTACPGALPWSPLDVRDVLKELSDLATLYKESKPEDTLQWIDRLFSGFDASARQKLPGVMKELDSMMKQQMTTTERKWYPTFFEGPLDTVRVSKHFAGLQGVFYVTDQQQPSSTPDEDSECGWSDDRSVAGDELDIDWMLYLSSKTFPDELMQQLITAPRPDVSLARYEKSGLNIMGQYVELQWHLYSNPEGSFSSLEQVCAFQKARAQRHRPACPQDLRWSCGPSSNSRPYLTGKEMVIINEGVCDYNAGCDGELSDFIAYLRRSSDHTKAEATNPVPHWIDQIDQNELLDPHDFAPCACGGKAMEELLLYREGSEPGYPAQESCTLFFEPSFLSVDVLDEEYDRKEQEEEAFLMDTPPRCREIIQVCDVHAIPTNNIWVLIDSCFEDPNGRIAPEGGSLPVPGMLTRTSYPPGFHITPGFLQVPFEHLVPRCEHGDLHPPALEFCPECFPSGQHLDCLECEGHPVLRKEKGCDFALTEFQELENRKRQYDQDQFAAAYQAMRVNEYFQQFEMQTATQCLAYHW